MIQSATKNKKPLPHNSKLVVFGFLLIVTSFIGALTTQHFLKYKALESNEHIAEINSLSNSSASLLNNLSNLLRAYQKSAGDVINSVDMTAIPFNLDLLSFFVLNPNASAQNSNSSAPSLEHIKNVQPDNHASTETTKPFLTAAYQQNEITYFALIIYEERENLYYGLSFPEQEFKNYLLSGKDLGEHDYLITLSTPTQKLIWLYFSHNQSTNTNKQEDLGYKEIDNIPDAIGVELSEYSLTLYLIESSGQIFFDWIIGYLPFLCSIFLIAGLFAYVWFKDQNKLNEENKEKEKILAQVNQLNSYYKRIIDGSIQGILIHDDFNPLFANQAFLKMHGISTLNELLSIKSIENLMGEDAQSALLQIWDNLSIDSDKKDIQRTLMRKLDGTDLWVSINVQKTIWDNKEAIQTTYIDITEQIMHEMELEYNRAKHEDTANELISIAEELDIALRKSKDAQLFQEKLMHTIPNPIYVKNKMGVIIQCNSAFLEFIEQEKEKVINHKLDNFLPPKQAALLDVNESEIFSHQKPQKFEIEYTTANQVKKHILVNKTVYKNTFEEVDGLITALVDITDRKIFENELKRLATVDPLTGSYNRRRFLDLSNLEFVRAERYNLNLCVIMLDIDHFKSINDTYGHAVGDDALISLSKLCRKSIRETDIFGRMGGEEFALTLPNTTIEEGMEVAERLRDLISKIEIHTDDKTFSFTASMGLTIFHAKSDDSISHALQRADESLYKAKQGGRNCVITSDNISKAKKSSVKNVG